MSLKAAQGPARDARRLEQALADEGDDGAVALDPDLAQLGEVGGELVDVGLPVDGRRDAHLGGGHEVDAHPPAAEGLEDAREEARAAEHARRASP